MTPPILIRPFAPASDSVPAITALLHAAYGALAARGLHYVASHQDDATTLSRLQRGHPFVAESAGEIVGTITLYTHRADAPCEWYCRPGVHHFGQFGVRPDLQRRGLGRRLYQQVEDHARHLGAHHLALDTAESADHLRRWYERLGFRFVQHVSWGDTNYRSVVLSKALRPDRAA
jgi:GNAT superfamily N-acetyltransferase